MRTSNAECGSGNGPRDLPESYRRTQLFTGQMVEGKEVDDDPK